MRLGPKILVFGGGGELVATSIILATNGVPPIRTWCWWGVQLAIIVIAAWRFWEFDDTTEKKITKRGEF